MSSFKLCLFILFLSGGFLFSALYLYDGKNHKIAYLLLVGAIIFGISGININVKGVYIHSVTFMLLFFIPHFIKNTRRVMQDKKICALYLIYMILIALVCIQLKFLNIRAIEEYGFILFTNVVLFLILMFFSAISVHNYSISLIYKIFKIVILFNSLLCILQFISEKELLLFTYSKSIIYDEGIYRVVGISGSHNAAGPLTAVFYILTLYLLYNEQNLKNIVLFILNLTACVLTFTRAGYLGVIVGSLIFAFYISKDQFKRILFLFIFTSIVTVCVVYYYDILNEILFIRRGDTFQGRVSHFYGGLSLLKERWLLGIGAGQYSLYSNFFNTAMHSYIFSILVERGFIYFCFYILSLHLIFRKMSLIYYKDKWFPASLIITYVVATAFNPAQFYRTNDIVFYFLVFGIMFSHEVYNTDSIIKQYKKDFSEAKIIRKSVATKVLEEY